MANNQEFNSIDELFRKSFNDLPSTPANNGWDTPSDRVWENIHSNVQSPSGGWSLGTKLLVGASISALLLVAAYWAFNRTAPAPATPNSTEQPTVAPAQPVLAPPAAADAPNKAVENTETTKVKPAEKSGKTPAAKAPATTDADNNSPKNTSEKTKPVPNSIEKRKLEQVKQD